MRYREKISPSPLNLIGLFEAFRFAQAKFTLLMQRVCEV